MQRATTSMHHRKWSARSLTALTLAILMVFAILPSRSYAADTVTDLNFDTTASTITVFAADDPYYLNLYATLSGSSSQIDVTDSATWKSSNTAVAKVTQGTITGVAKGTAKISATYGGYTKSVTVTVDDLYDSIQILSNNSEAPDEASVQLGQDISYTLSGLKTGLQPSNLTTTASWSSSNTAVATVEDGDVTLLGAGTATITASYKGKTDKIKLTVISPYKSITLSGPDLLEFTVGDASVDLTATAVSQNGSSANITKDADWTSSNTAVATVENGTITPLSTGTATITVSHLGASDKVTIAVRQGTQELKLTPSTDLSLQLQDAPVVITASALELNGSTPNVSDSAEWTSSDIMVATVANGVVTPKGIGTTTIKASYKGATRSIKVTIYPTVNGLTIKEADQKVETFLDQTGTLPQLTATTYGGDSVTVTPLVTWTSSNNNIVSIDSGKWKAVATGTAVLTASVNGYAASVTITVNDKPLTLIAAQTELSLIIGKDYSFPQVRVVYENGNEEDITEKINWKSSSTNLLVQPSGIKGLTSANATLTGTFLNKTVKISVTIEEEVVKLVADPTSLTLNPKKSKSLKIKAFYKSGKSVIVSTKVNWSISDDEVAEFSSKNTVRALSKGTAVITGTYQNKSVTISLSVVPKLKTLVLSEKTLKLSIGDAKTLKLKAFYDDGTYIDQTENAEWTSSNTSVVTIVNGIIVAKAKGSASIKAKVEGKTVTLRVTVK
ncbi:Ig-like domain-containing protein [Paenibacillus sp. PR3]|uniref:Ig-like domain-containing protein n=1 Tax=Paenibacillus terricola TaxID=2763503 RepID=A0ABR8N0M3_9BACL|nr:Ig-like domain-containing protein [Paenibacillus terricola]MBD3920796.1 Ig-like domain-containing protein [Paenibacillus terricola]